MKKTALLLLLLYACLSGKAQTIDTIRWTELAPLPDTFQRSGSGYFLIDSDFYVAGGWKGYGAAGLFTSSVWRYHIPNNTWYRMNNMPLGGASTSGSFVLNGKGYFLEITDSANNNNCVHTFWQYDPIGDTWARMADFPDSTRQGSTCFVSNGKGYVGQTDGCSIPDAHFWQYDPNLDQWSQIASLPSSPQLVYASAAIAQPKSYINLFGGADQNGLFHNTVWQYSIATNSWFDIGQMPGIGRGSSLAWGFDSIFILGGGGLEDSSYNSNLASDFYKYNFLQGIWTPVKFINSFDSAAGGYSFVYDKKGYYFGGLSRWNPYSVYSNRLWSFDASRYIHDTGVGIAEVGNDYQFRLYPNPTERQKTLQVQCSEDGEITFYDLLGRICYQGALHSGFNTFDCAQLACGNKVLLYKASLKHEHSESGKVVILY